MPIISPHQFEQKPLQADVEKVAREVERRRDFPEMQEVSDRELVRHAVRSVAASTVSDDSGKDEEGKERSLPEYMKESSAETKHEVENLLEIVFRDGLGKATAMARKSNPLILDALHDAVAGKMYEKLQDMGVFPKR